MRILLKLPVYLTVLMPVFLLLGGAVSDIAISLIAVLFLVRSFLEKDWSWIKETWVRCLFLLWLYSIARGLFAEEPAEAMKRALPFGRYFIFAAALAYWTLRDALAEKYFLKVLTAVVLFAAGDGVLQWFAGKDILRHPIISFEGHTRLTGPFKSQILGVMLAWLSFPVCMQFIRVEDGKAKIDYRILTAPFIIAVIAMSGERMALLLALLGWLIALLLLPVRKIYALGVIAAGLLLVAVVLCASPELFQRQVSSTIDTLNNWQASPYGQLLASDMKVAKVNPVFGIGSNHFRIVCKDVLPDPAPCGSLHPHNIYMEWLIEQGAIGLCLFIAFIATIIKKAVAYWPLVRNNPVFLGLVIAVFVRLWPFMSTTGFLSRWGAPPFWLIIGMFLMYITRKEEKLENRL